ncbi:MAG: protein-arginine deiminase family protein [Myxococcales bacterium]|jgi:protein-arginine deiminase
MSRICVPLAVLLAAGLLACGDDEPAEPTAPDAAIAADAGALSDAGESDDAGGGDEDAGLVPDAGEPDAGLPVPTLDLRADVNRDGVVDLEDPAEDLGEDTWDATRGAVFLANIDDDLSACPKASSTSDINLPECHDAADSVVNGEDDLLDMAPLQVKPWPQAPEGTEAQLEVSSPGASYVRFFRKGEDGSWSALEVTAVFSSTDLREGVELLMEGTDIVRDSEVWDGFVDVTLRAVVPGAEGAEAEELSDTIRFRISPVMTSHHVSPVQTLYTTIVPRDADSAAFRRDLRAAVEASSVPNPLVELSVPGRYADQWTQDFFETGYMAMPAPGGQHVIRVVYRSANIDDPGSSTNPLRPAGKIAFTYFRGKDFAAVQEFDRSSDLDMDTLNSFGNTETIPPYSWNGVDYPLGRLMRGSVAHYHPDRKLARLLESQGMQPPVYLDTSWLLVAHVDETITFLKADTPRGWIALVNDPRLARQMLLDESSRGNGAVRMFEGKYWYDWWSYNTYPAAVSIDEVLADTEIMAESARSAAEVDAQVAILKAETGLTDEEIVKVPFLHQPVGGSSLAYQPGTVNGVALDEHNYVAPDPHGPVIDGQDIFKAQLERALAPFGYTVHWVEDWGLYHALAGEVHCGSNAVREVPEVKWWETGR